MVLFLLTLEVGKAEPHRRTVRKLAQALGVGSAELASNGHEAQWCPNLLAGKRRYI
jgi:hypothetical protein